MKKTIIFILISIATVSSYSQSLHLNKTTFVPGETIIVNFYNTPQNGKDWIAIYKENAIDKQYITWQYTKGVRTGNLTFKAPNNAGRYNFRLFLNDGYKRLAVSNSFSVGTKTVPQQTNSYSPTIRLNKTSFALGENIQLRFTAPANYPSNAWIGIIPSHISHGNEDVNDKHDIAYKYISKKTSGVFNFKAPSKAGQYDFRMNDRDGGGKETAYVSFTVGRGNSSSVPQQTNSYSPAVRLNKTTFAPGEIVIINFYNTPRNNKDWIAMYKENTTDKQHITWQYTKGIRTGNLTFKAPNNAGRYNFRLFLNDGYKRLAVSNSFSVRTKTVPQQTTTTSQAYPLEFIYIQGGTLNLGHPAHIPKTLSHPMHPVTMNSFRISKYETTNAQFAEFLNTKGVSAYGMLNGKKYITMNGKHNQIYYSNGRFICQTRKENYPVLWVTWEGANAFAKWVGGRLPTEAEWEYAARGGQKSRGYIYSGSNNLDEVGWYSKNSHNPNNNMFNGTGTHKVGLKKPNELGIYDMTGNVWEWCSDWYSTKNISIPENNPKGPKSGTLHSLRGGAFDNWAIYTYVFERFNRYSYKADSYRISGFRVIK